MDHAGSGIDGPPQYSPCYLSHPLRSHNPGAVFLRAVALSEGENAYTHSIFRIPPCNPIPITLSTIILKGLKKLSPVFEARKLLFSPIKTSALPSSPIPFTPASLSRRWRAVPACSLRSGCLSGPPLPRFTPNPVLTPANQRSLHESGSRATRSPTLPRLLRAILFRLAERQRRAK